ncbi:hypothetical protein Slala03_74210 [Streptomyces lavendulae subsp. lavendulae]|nr:hypothetical protein Slala03_74210 [Streptomyces lavendulae subsp. lavendulae]
MTPGGRGDGGEAGPRCDVRVLRRLGTVPCRTGTRLVSFRRAPAGTYRNDFGIPILLLSELRAATPRGMRRVSERGSDGMGAHPGTNSGAGPDGKASVRIQ